MRRFESEEWTISRLIERVNRGRALASVRLKFDCCLSESRNRRMRNGAGSTLSERLTWEGFSKRAADILHWKAAYCSGSR